MHIRVGTRGSKLALAQTDRVIRELEEHGVKAERIILTTKGDTITGVPLHEIGGQGVFVRALDDAILSGEIDCAVHSMKDIPAFRPLGLFTAAVLKRDSPADYIAYSSTLQEVRVIGTSSTRRRAQLLRSNPDLVIRDLRGNVDTRIRKLNAGEFDAIILAEAGLARLSLQIPGEQLSPEKYVPSPNQGTIAVVSRADPSLMEVLSVLDDPRTRADVAAERAVMEQIGGGCFTPIGIYCESGHLIAEVLSLDGRRTERVDTVVDTIEKAREQGRLLRDAAQDLILEAHTKLKVSE
ncbi:MAG TPA: hydroxymethylbilane synthase [Methanoregulaceae archaeon]|nr:hydroxymethylbilane synthase [Methanoregulaceae archaeon]HPD76438.1 hydroxymethylbilane synthase [Methanoregulaceae archaeon]